MLQDRKTDKQADVTSRKPLKLTPNDIKKSKREERKFEPASTRWKVG